ncbi:MAG: Glyoxalase/bleomycin resistance protein/dioxygenase [Glaciihabitans sp.]|nr:Glyoxalase/bleomycin resistance protein/dioxygenase [Glaciihabitans sp.]
MIAISVTSVFVDNQQNALEFYTSVLGFTAKLDISLGEDPDADRWLTVVSSDASDAVQLLLEPNSNPVAKAYQDGIRAQGIPATMFSVDDIRAEYDRLVGLDVSFVQEPTQQGDVVTAILDDTCGNLITLAQY